MVPAFPFLLAADAGFRAALTLRNGRPGVVVIEFVFGDKGAAVVVYAVDTEKARRIVFFGFG